MLSRMTKILVTGATVAAVGGAWAGAASASTSHAAASPTIALHFSGGTSTTVNVLHKKRFGVGDETIVNQPCYNAANHKQKEGHGIVILTAVSRNSAAAVATVFLKGGDITLTGLLTFSNTPSAFAVTGGTGSYADAQGYATVQGVGGNNAVNVTIHLES
jgi:hypothetical protein